MDNINSYIRSARQVGHTTLLKEGMKNYNKPFFIVGADGQQANRLRDEIGNKNAIAISVNTPPQKFAGKDYPMVMDNHAYTKTCEKYDLLVQNLKGTIVEQSDDIERTYRERKRLENLYKVEQYNRRLDVAMLKRHKRLELKSRDEKFDAMEADKNAVIYYMTSEDEKLKEIERLKGLTLFQRIFQFKKLTR